MKCGNVEIMWEYRNSRIENFVEKEIELWIIFIKLEKIRVLAWKKMWKTF